MAISVVARGAAVIGRGVVKAIGKGISGGNNHFSVSTNFDLKRINLNLSREINDAADIIVSDIKSGIQYGRDIEGKPFTKLNPATITAKRLSGSKTPRMILSDKEKMKKVYVSKKASKSSQSAEIIPPKKRSDVGVYHQEGKGTLPERIWFGVSKTAEKKAMDMMELRIEQEIRNA